MAQDQATKRAFPSFPSVWRVKILRPFNPHGIRQTGTVSFLSVDETALRARLSVLTHYSSRAKLKLWSKLCDIEQDQCFSLVLQGAGVMRKEEHEMYNKYVVFI